MGEVCYFATVWGLFDWDAVNGVATAVLRFATVLRCQAIRAQISANAAIVVARIVAMMANQVEGNKIVQTQLYPSRSLFVASGWLLKYRQVGARRQPTMDSSPQARMLYFPHD